MDYVIVGNSAAGISAADTLRRLNPDARITMVDYDSHGAYARCMIPEVVSGESELSGIIYRNEYFYQSRGIELLRDRVVSLHPERHLVKLASGKELCYHRLLVATGAKPVKLDIEGMDVLGVLNLRTYDDAVNLATLAVKSHRAVVLGGGLVGIKGALALRRRGVPRVTVVVKSNRLLSRQLTSEASALLEHELALAGVTVIRGMNPKRIGSNAGRVNTVVLENGRELLADIVLAAKGVRPNAGLVRDAGGLADRGIQVNDYLQTSLNDVYAAGDCIEVTDTVTGRKSPAGLWPLAVEQGRYAAFNMSGRRRKYPPPVASMNAVRFGDFSIISVGPVDISGDKVFTYGPKNGVYRRLVFRDGRLVSAVFTGSIERAGIYTWLIRSKRRVTEGLRKKLENGTITAADLAMAQ